MQCHRTGYDRHNIYTHASKPDKLKERVQQHNSGTSLLLYVLYVVQIDCSTAVLMYTCTWYTIRNCWSVYHNIQHAASPARALVVLVKANVVVRSQSPAVVLAYECKRPVLPYAHPQLRRVD